MNTLDLISYYLNNIAIAIGIISICYVLWINSKNYGENLIMEENPIKITIDNYCGQRITFMMSEDAKIESSLCIEDSITGTAVTGIRINATDKEILIEKEDLPA